MTVVDIDRRHKLPYEDFAHEYLFPNKPVILSGALEGWQAVANWTPDYFKDKYGSMNLSIDGKDYTMAEFIDRVNSSTPENPAPYLRNAIVDQLLPELLSDIEPLPSYFFPNWLDGRFSHALRSRLHSGSPELYIGGSGAKFPFLHFDSYHTHAFLAQVYGIKEYTAFSPDQTPYIYVSPNKYNASEIPDLETPDLEKYSRRPVAYRKDAHAIYLDFREPGKCIQLVATDARRVHALSAALETHRRGVPDRYARIPHAP
jgi:hypothetical protein